MSELLTFMQLGFRHIVNLEAMDHILFLLALAAIYRPRDWRSALWVVTAFTVGHSVTLALAVTGAMVLPIKLIEFLIPVTIVATCIENIIVRDRASAPLGRRYRPVFAAVFRYQDAAHKPRRSFFPEHFRPGQIMCAAHYGPCPAFYFRVEG